MKKLFTLLSAFIVCLSASAYDFEYYGLYYNILPDRDNCVEVTQPDKDSFGYDNIDDLSIPEYVYDDNYNQYTVVAIGDSAFYNREPWNPCQNIYTLSLPYTLETIGEASFYGCENLASVTIPYNVYYIGDYAFYGCSNLSSLTLNNGEIGEWAFANCTNLSNVDFGNIYKIGMAAFKYCAMKNIDIPSSISRIDNFAFSSMPSLETVTVPWDTSTSFGGYVFESDINLQNVIRTSSLLIKIPESYTSYTIPSDITGLVGGVFQESNITSMEIPSTVKKIGIATFWGCKELTSVTLPDGIKELPGQFLYNCTAMKEFTIPASVNTVHAAMMFFTDLDKLTIEDSETTLAYSNQCYDEISNYTYQFPQQELFNSAKDIYVGRNLNNCTNGWGVVYFLGSNMYRTETLTIGPKVTIMPSNIETATSLTEFTIGESITSVPDYSDLKALTTLTCNAMVPPTAVAFSQEAYDNCKLCVHSSVIDDYKTAEVWKNFKYIDVISGDTPTGIANVSSANTTEDTYYTLSGMKTTTPSKGIHIKNGKKYIIK